MSGTESGDQRFPKSSRLLSAKDYQHVFADAKAERERLFTVLSRVNDRQAARLGLIVSRRVNKRAVVRNAIKRVVRESFRCSAIRACSLDIVVIARSAASVASNSQRRQALERALARLEN